MAAVDRRDIDRSWWVRLGAAAVIIPAISLVGAEIVLLLAVGNLDVEFALEEAGSSVDVVYAVTFGVAAAIAGALVGLVAALRGWQVLVPSMTGLAAGLVAGFVAVALAELGWPSLVLFVVLVGGVSLLTSWRLLTHEPTPGRPVSV